MTLPPELCEKIIAHLGSKDLWNKIWRCDEAPKTYKNIIESEMISQILRGELTIDVFFHKKIQVSIPPHVFFEPVFNVNTGTTFFSSLFS